MKNFILMGLLLFSTFAATAQTETTMENQKDSASYAFGVMVAQSLLRQMSDDLNYDLIAEGLKDGLNGDESKMTGDAAMALYQAYSMEMKRKAGAAAREIGEKFLAENAKREEVKTTASGLQYEVLQAGEGEMHPSATDQVTVHYHGTFIDGKVFDSSVERGQPATFGLNQVIKGWTEGVQLMVPGDKYRFYIPYNLAYGDNGSGGRIPPYSALIFEVELLEIKGK